MPPENDFDPNGKSKSTSLKADENKVDSSKIQASNNLNNNNNLKPIIVWRNVLIFSFLHMGALCGIFCCFYAMRATLIFCEYFIFYVQELIFDLYIKYVIFLIT
jgi:hypothetical protein